MIEALECRRLFTATLRPDLSYGDAGRAGVAVSGYSDQAAVNLFDANDRPIVVRSVALGDIEFNPYTTRVSRATVHGDRDKTFGPQRGSIDVGGYNFAADVQANGQVVVGEGDSLVRLTVNGRLDPAFGDGGRVALPHDAAYDGRPAVRALANGKIRAALGKSDLYQFNADGTPDASFGTNGRVRISAIGPAGAVEVDNAPTTLFDPLGRPYVLVQGSGTIAQLTRFADNGQPDPAYGIGGRVDLGKGLVDAGYDTQALILSPSIDFTPDGGALLTLRPADLNKGGRRLVKVTADGKIDRQFGTNGRIDFAVPKTTDVSAFEAVVDPSSGKIYVSQTSTPRHGLPATKVVRLLPIGAIDRHFATQAHTFVTAVSPGGRAYAGTTRLAFLEAAAIDRSGTRLFIDGTDGNDTIAIDGRRVTVNGERFTFDPTVVTSVTADLFDGDDTFVSNAAAATTVTGRSGHSYVETGGGNDTITLDEYGGDSVQSRGGNDLISVGRGGFADGGRGADTIGGGLAAVLIGGPGDDLIRVTNDRQSSGGRPVIYGGDGNDRIEIHAYVSAAVYAEAGNDIVTSFYSAKTQFFGGEGADLLRSYDRRNDSFPDQGPDDIVRHL